MSGRVQERCFTTARKATRVSVGPTSPGRAPASAGLQRLLDLQRTAGNAAVCTMLQRRWDPGLVATNPAYSGLPAKMLQILPHTRAARLAKFAAATESPEQLIALLELADADKLERLLPMGSGNLAALSTLAPTAEGFQKLAFGCLRHRIGAKEAVEADPSLTAADLQKKVDAAQEAANIAAGLVSGKGDPIAWQPASSIVGDGCKDEPAAVAEALAALAGGTSRGTYHGNNSGDLPGVARAGGYTEYDVRPPPGTRDAGRRRLVVSNAKKFVYYTWNHYGNDGTSLPAFKRIQ